MRLAIPGTDAASAHLPHEMSMPILAAASTATGLPAMAVMNIAEVTTLTCSDVSSRYAPSFLRESSGSGLESSNLLSETMIG